MIKFKDFKNDLYRVLADTNTVITTFPINHATDDKTTVHVYQFVQGAIYQRKPKLMVTVTFSEHYFGKRSDTIKLEFYNNWKIIKISNDIVTFDFNCVESDATPKELLDYTFATIEKAIHEKTVLLEKVI